MIKKAKSTKKKVTNKKVTKKSPVKNKEVLKKTQKLLSKTQKIDQKPLSIPRQYLLESLMKNTSDAIYFKDLKGRFITISPPAAKILGVKKIADAIGKTDADFFSKEKAKRFRSEELRIIRTGKSLVNMEHKKTNSDGTAAWSSSTKMPIVGAKGKIVGTLGITRDLTDQKKIEIEREKDLKKLKQTLNHIKALGGLLPICSLCKKIRKKNGTWQEVDEYIREHSNTSFTHSYCPECANKEIGS